MVWNYGYKFNLDRSLQQATNDQSQQTVDHLDLNSPVVLLNDLG